MSTSKRPWVWLAVAGAVLVGVAAVIVLVDDEETTEPRASKTTTSTSTPGSSLDTSTVVWPVESSTTRYAAPTDAALGFATDYVAFASPVVGELRQGDTRSGEVDVQPFAGGPTTTVLVRQLADDSWWVIGATTANIQVTQPAAFATITSPLTLGGTSTAFEATVNVEVREDGSDQALGTGLVMGGANGALGPFRSALTFQPATQRFGGIVFFTVSPEDAGVLEATVLRIAFT